MKPRNLGENLQHLMKEKHLSVRDLAQGIGVSQRTVNEWIGSGSRTPRSLDQIKKLANFLEVSVHSLLFGEEDPKSFIGEFLEKSELHVGLYEISIKRVSRSEKNQG